MKLRRWAAPVVLTSLLLVSGCGGTDLTPGTAAKVDGTKISQTDVEELADAQCAGVALAVKSSQGEPASRKVLVQQALSLLMDIELNLKFGASEGLEPRPEATTALYAQVQPLIDALPKDAQPVTEEVFKRWADGRDMLAQVGEEKTGQTATAANEQDILNAGYQAREPWLKKREIVTDPRYSPNEQGFPGAGDGSVSEAASSFAKSASAETPAAAFIGDLPPGQRCG